VLTTPVFTALPPLSLYIHIPWCAKKCPYCDFNSHALKESGPDEQRYVDALMRDLESTLPMMWGRTVHTVFFGGGTPSLFSARAIDDILCGVRARLKLAADAEITLEANPGSVEAGKFAEFFAAGINRLSIGIQSFNPAHLRALGRIHDAQEAHQAVEIGLRTVGNVNLDVMYALPEQTLEEALADVAAALRYGTPHLSCYHLTLEPNTLFHRYPPPLPDDDLAATMQERIEEQLAQHGYQHYETSAFAQPNMQCAHNVNYWKFGDYLGIGAGAHGKISLPNAILRTVKAKQPAQYMEAAENDVAEIERRSVSRDEVGFEFMLNLLRLREGFPVPMFAERTGYPISLIDKSLNLAEAKGFITRDHLRIAPTPLGRRFLNDAQALFLVD
jgi:putative oxygen-independent coproporphyrinogen III oxidase